MKFCTNCGSQVPDTSKFCPGCGQKIEIPAAPVQAPMAESAPIPVAEPAPVPVAVSASVKAEPVTAATTAEVRVYGQPVAHNFSAPADSESAQSVVHTYGAPVSHNFTPPVPANETISGTYGAGAATPAAPKTAPAPQLVAAPAPQPVAPPVQQYAPPAQQYAPPAQQYAPPAQQYTPPASKAKKQSSFDIKALLGNKMVRFGAIGVLVLLLVIGLISCFGGSSKDDPNLGLYNAVSCTYSGIDLGVDDEWIELKSGGKLDMRFMGDEYSGKWKLDGTEITITQAGDDYTGTLKDGTLVVDFDGLIYTYVMEGYTASNNGSGNLANLIPTGVPGEQASSNGEVGYWTLLRADSDDPSMAMDEETVQLLQGMGMQMYVELKEDGTGVFCVEEAKAITWGDGSLTADGESIAYTLSDGQLLVEMDGMTMVFVPGDPSAAPEISVTPEETPTEAPVAATEAAPAATQAPAATNEVALEDWEGDYYGWWVIDYVRTGDSGYEGNWWDCCVTIDFNADGTGTMTIWDEDTTKADPLSVVDISGSIVNGTTARIVSESGYFMDCSVAHADWLFYSDDTSYEDTLGFYTYYVSTDLDMECYFFIRPWGMTWDDIQAENPDYMTYYYEDWYLPLIQGGTTTAPTGYVGE